MYQGFKGFRKGGNGEAYCKPTTSMKKFTYKKGGIYKSSNLMICRTGFHFCQDLTSVNSFYRFDDNKNVFALVTALGKTEHRGLNRDSGKPLKSVTDKIRIDSDFYGFFHFLSFINYPHTGIRSSDQCAIKRVYSGSNNHNLQKDAVIRKLIVTPEKTIEYRLLNCTNKRLQTGWLLKDYKLVIKKYKYSKDKKVVVEIQNK